MAVYFINRNNTAMMHDMNAEYWYSVGLVLSYPKIGIVI